MRFTKFSLTSLGRRYITDTKRSFINPLNVLFFGSDEFSIQSLLMLNSIKQNNPSIVNNIQLVTRSPKWCGRQKSVLKYPPIMDTCKQLGLPEVITCDSKQEMITNLTSMMDQSKFDTMLIAVSFGKLIPSALINLASYSLNVHPSLLPRYKGSSPIQYTLLNQDKYTGVSIQTLHPEKFDHGDIVAQTDEIEVNTLLQNPIDISPWKTATLMHQLGLRGANLLGDVIAGRQYVEHSKTIRKYESSLAPVIKTDDKRIKWHQDSASQLCNKIDVLGPVFTFKEVQKGKKRKSATDFEEKRVLFHELEPITTDIRSELSLILNKPGAFTYNDSTGGMYVRCGHDDFIEVKRLQFEAFPIESSQEFMNKLRKRCGPLMAENTTYI